MFYLGKLSFEFFRKLQMDPLNCRETMTHVSFDSYHTSQDKRVLLECDLSGS